MQRKARLAIPFPMNRATQKKALDQNSTSALGGLAAYSDSEGSEDEALVKPTTPGPAVTAAPAATTTSAEDDEFAAFMADINNAQPDSKEVEQPSIIPLPPPVQQPQPPSTSEPTPVKPASSFPLPFSLPDVSKFSSTPLQPPLKSSPLYSKLDGILARIDQLPALPVTLPPEYQQVIDKRRTEFDTRCKDWKRGALLDSYFDEVVLRNYEEQVDLIEALYCPDGWNIYWDEATESHYFECIDNATVSWSWPEIAPLPKDPIAPPLPIGEPPASSKEAHAVSGMEIVAEPPADLASTSACSTTLPESTSTAADAATKKTKRITRPDVVSISAKSKKMASMLKNWHTAKTELREMDEEEQERINQDPEEAAFEKLQKWADTQVDSHNPNFVPIVPRKRARAEEDA
ncbi:UNVERIFIED_CONTAM: hypothetical protein HDU68_002188 [Siphonaria sp. JEL0065]|nr:hypothetical protein HDU68_002188 [Siphonaria sp. JEL0065]